MNKRDLKKAFSAIERECVIVTRFPINLAACKRTAAFVLSRLQLENRDGGFRCAAAKATMRVWYLRLNKDRSSLKELLCDPDFVTSPLHSSTGL